MSNIIITSIRVLAGRPCHVETKESSNGPSEPYSVVIPEFNRSVDVECGLLMPVEWYAKRLMLSMKDARVIYRCVQRQVTGIRLRDSFDNFDI